jgi:hypothetical protein
MRHGADWRNPAQEAVRIVPFRGDLNHGKIQAGRVRSKAPVNQTPALRWRRSEFAFAAVETIPHPRRSDSD